MLQQPVESELNRVHPYAAGLDIGASEHWVSIPAELDPEPVRRFGRHYHGGNGVYGRLLDSRISSPRNEWIRSAIGERALC